MSVQCDWWWDDPCWTSDCGMAFEFNDGGPTDNQFKFCPGCGKEVSEIDRYIEPEDTGTPT